MSWFDWVPTLLNVGTQLYTNSTANAASRSAANTEAAAAKAAADAQVAGQQQAAGYYAASKANDQALQTQAAPGVSQQQLAIAQQNTLTPAQNLALDNARRQSMTALNTSGLRGSGRATVATIKDVDNTMRTQYMDQNRQRADQAATALSSQYFTSGRDINNSNTQIGQSKVGAGQATAQGITGAADANAAGTLAVGQQNVDTSGQAINDIASQIASANKKNQSSYTNPSSNTGGL